MFLAHGIRQISPKHRIASAAAPAALILALAASGLAQEDASRFDVMGNPPTFGDTPQPSAETLKRYDRFVERTIDADNTLDLVVGRPRVLVFKGVPLRVQVPNEDVASYVILSEHELSVVGNEVGTTMLNIWFQHPDNPDVTETLSYLVRVIPDPEAKERMERAYEALQKEINATFPDSNVELELVGEKLIVRGEAKDVVEAAQIIRIVQMNAPGGGKGGDSKNIPVESVETNADSKLPGMDKYLVPGSPNIINLLRVPGEGQVQLRVTVAEVNRAAARSLGMNFSFVDNEGDFSISSLAGNVAKGGSNTFPISYNDGHQYNLAVNALRSLNLARSLAEPTLTAMNGETASFQAGGKFPVPIVTGDRQTGGLQGVDFVGYGIQLKFTPYVTDRDKIRMDVNAEVSTRQLATGTTIGNSSVSGLDTRNFTTTIELREGQTLAIAGLVQQTYGATSDRVPLLGDLPLVGPFFGFNRVSADEQELVVLVTPELIHPLEMAEVGPLPGDDVFEPNDIEFFLFNRLESRIPTDFRGQVRTDFGRMISSPSRPRYIGAEPNADLRRRTDKAEDRFISGPSGYTK